MTREHRRSPSGSTPRSSTSLRVDRSTRWRRRCPPWKRGTTVAEFLATRPRLSAFATPLLVLDAAAIDANVARMAAWCARPRRRPGAAREDDDGAGAVGAPARRGRVGHHAGHAVAGAGRRWPSGCAGCMLANALVDPVGVAAVSRALDADPDLAGSVAGSTPSASVAAMDRGPAGLRPARPLTVLVELGAPGGRTGARDLPAARAVADAVAASPHLRLGGVAGYEGALAHDASPAGLDAVRRYLRDLAALHAALAGAYEADEAVVTAGGSAYFDDVADVLGPLAGPGTRVLAALGRLRHPRRRLLPRHLAASPGTDDAPLRLGHARLGARSSPGPSPAWPCSTPASGTSRSTRACPSRSWPPTRSAPRRAR